MLLKMMRRPLNTNMLISSHHSLFVGPVRAEKAFKAKRAFVVPIDESGETRLAYLRAEVSVRIYRHICKKPKILLFCDEKMERFRFIVHSLSLYLRKLEVEKAYIFKN